jgi:hypothetical protein
VLVLLALLFLVVAGVALAAAFGIGTSKTRAERTTVFGGTGWMIAAVGAVISVVVLGLVAAVGLGVRDEGSDHEPVQTAAPSQPTQPAVTTTTAPAPLDVRTRGGSAGPDVVMSAFEGEGFPPPPPIVDELPSGAVLRITARGFAPHENGTVQQCAGAMCVNSFPVTFDELGVARFQYLLQTDAAPFTCRADAAPCVVRVSTEADRAFLRTVVGGPAPQTRLVSVAPPPRDLDDYTELTVSVQNFLPGERLQAVLCAAPETSGATRCGAPGPVAHFAVGADGRGSTVMVVRRGSVGTEQIACGRETPCGVVVQSPSGVAAGPVVVVDFSLGPAASYSAARVLVGLGIAVLLLVLAAYLIRTTDWRKPSEAETPDLDSASLIEL